MRPTELLLAPVGAGKTRYALDALVQTIRESTFAKIWVLLPSRRQEDAFRQRLIDHDPRRAYFNVHFFNFYSLYARLLDIAGSPQRNLDDTARARLLREILLNLKRGDQLEVYGGIADKPGFIQVVAQFIYELKQNLVEPDDYEAAARAAKDRDLARIYIDYQSTLRRYELVDREGEGWLALAAVRDKPDMATDVALLLADGFDQFNTLQAQLLTRLAARAQRALITLPTVLARETTIGRRFQEAFNRLQAAHDGIGHPTQVQRIAAVPEITRRPALRYLIENSFLPIEKPRSSEGCLRLIEAPDPAQEVGAVLRQVKRLLLTTNCAPDEVLVAVRDWARYAGHFAAQGRTYGIPLSWHYGEPLTENPAIVALLNLLELSENRFRRRDLLDTLRSPYFAIPGISSPQVDALERVSRSQLIIAGREEWLLGIRQAGQKPEKSDDERETLTLDAADVAHLEAYLNHFLDFITPPPRNTMIGYVNWLEQLIGPDSQSNPDEEPPQTNPRLHSLHLIRQLRGSTDDDAIIDRDLSAIHAFKQVLRNLIGIQNLFLALRLVEKVTQPWPEFLTDLKAALGVASIHREANRSGKVLVTTVADARGLPHRHVFVPGLSEGIFPAPIAEDPLYLDSERAALTQRGVMLETSAEQAADEGLFYELISQARESLTLSRPTVQNGALWAESHLWRAVRDLFDDSASIVEANQTRLGGVVAAVDAASASEALLAVANGLNQAEVEASVAGLYNWLVSTRSIDWARVRLGRQIELGRMSRGAHNRYSGRLQDAGLVAIAARELGPGRVWSASQFNDYGMCGFRFFAKRLLKLEALEEPEEGMDPAQRGTVNHAILERTYRTLRRLGASITPDCLELALMILHRVAGRVLRHAPRRYGFRAGPLWEQEKVTLTRKLEKVVRLDFADDSPIAKHFGEATRQPYRIETPFNLNGGDVIQIEIDAALGPLYARGYIDRLDRQENRLILIDYKSGRNKIPTADMQAGRNFQMLLYLLAAEHVLASDPDPHRPTEIAGGLFWHLGDQKTSGEFRWDDSDDETALQEGMARLGEQIARGRGGDFSVQPNKGAHGPCAHYCEFSQLCRVSIISRAKRS